MANKLRSILKFTLPTLAALISLWGGSTAVADGILRDGVGAISTGRGGTNLGFADNGNILLDNPAALVNVQGNGLYEIGVDAIITDLQYSDADNGVTSAANNPFPMGQLAIINKTADGNIAWGLGAFSQAGFAAEYDLNGPVPFTGTQHYKSLGALMRILPGVSLALTPEWSIGGTLGVAVSHTELEGPYFTQYPTPFIGTPTLIDLQGTGAGLSWSFGTQYQLSSATTLGLSFQGETHITSHGTAALTVPGLGSSRYDLSIETQWPSVLGLGLAHRLNCCSVVAVDVLWTRWSAAKDAYDMAMTNPSNPVFAGVIGPLLPERFPLEWSDSVAVRVGYQRLLRNGHILRTGYVFHPNPIPAATLTPFIQSIVEHSVSVGYGWRIGDYGIDLGYQFMVGPDQSVETSNFIGGDFDHSTSSANAHWVLASVNRRF